MTDKILTFEISPDGDLEVKSIRKGDDQAIYTLKRETMVAKSQYFKNLLRYTHLGDQSSPGITLEDDDPEALNVWFRHLHAEGDAERKELQQPNQLSDISVRTIWHLACVGDKNNFDGEVLGDFFKKWYRHHVRLSNNNSNDGEEFPYNFVAYVKTLPFPCLVLDHAEGFAETTKWLAYNSIGHIREVRPPGFTSKYHHLSPKDFVGPLNAARGRLKTILGQGLCNASDDILTRGRYDCTCKQYRAVVGQYLEELSRVRVDPLEKSVLSNSIARMLKLLDDFKLDPAEACSFCTKRWDLTVQSAVQRVNGYFDVCVSTAWIGRIITERTLRKTTGRSQWLSMESGMRTAELNMESPHGTIPGVGGMSIGKSSWICVALAWIRDGFILITPLMVPPMVLLMIRLEG
ncbi:hypothetical protein BU24DRAFT_448535 [Aaosphaeria arxii CBS 175.79]|uniref:BTB domain-containing protein n=1 Tax=Aaosphaeria arxii CBS 175.79 TaxID=1450172 RepID=A0A6A5Y4M3_9PLEO|nr:uncharacterized protein BU24DRAFT_448535 [Aaosphaeria arxii CBS 175.79]KAF2020206.1 hypothetical protein BU24DRAFT_448535 [Aaosphaeria arxii CBS 175.79]